jgi:hypothetical protein
LNRPVALAAFLLVITGCQQPLDMAINASNATTMIMQDARPRIELNCAGTAGTPKERPCLLVSDAFDAMVDVRLATHAAIDAVKTAEALGEKPNIAKLLTLTSELAVALRRFSDAYHALVSVK